MTAGNRGSAVRGFLESATAVLLLAFCNGMSAAAQDAASLERNDSGNRILYLANPYGFSAQQREGPLVALVTALEDMGAVVWEPFTRTSQIDTTSPGWAYRIGQADLRDVRDADGLFAVVNGCPPDEGVMVELGMAIAWGKPVFLFRDDFRRCTDSETYPLNLMVFTGLPETRWEAYWYGAIEEIADPGKALAQWLSGEPAAVATGSTGE
ncbi:nucleoside 2-deoxyribosyltransferase [Candidatus Rariloculus sp.]|uniref:nucleoside 2-deoxyribosyltransferase n=1 Tax=Candidatus Rariloculus sp. TaxID=3101265 RepID=UPI003D0BA567